MNIRLSRGVTLIELMVTLSILAILLGLAIPSFQSFIVSNRLTAQTNELLGAYQVARAEAIRLNRPVRLCRADTADAVACSNSRAAWRAWIVIRPDNNEIIQRGAVRANLVVLSSTNMLNDIIVFRSDSLATNINNAPLTATLQVCAAATNPQENGRNVRIALSRAVIERAQLGANGCNTAPGNA